MRERGLALIEVLLALSLLSGVMLVCASFTGELARVGATEEARMNWDRGARALLQRIGEDLLTQDFGLMIGERVSVIEHRLSIDTREASEKLCTGVRQYRFLREQQMIRGRAIDGSETNLLGDTTSFQVTLSLKALLLEVTLQSVHGSPLTRRYRLS